MSAPKQHSHCPEMLALYSHVFLKHQQLFLCVSCGYGMFWVFPFVCVGQQCCPQLPPTNIPYLTK